MEGSQEKENGVHLIYKDLGETPLETLNRFKKDNPSLEGVSVTYAGRLDPMAEGLLILLSGEKVDKKDSFLDLPKTYEFEILWGFETDTLDILGLVKSGEKIIPETKEIENYLKKFLGKFEQEYPAYSSKPVSGKPLFVWAREGKLGEIKIPSHEVEVFESNYISRRIVNSDEIKKDILSRISLVKGDFRQKEISDKWESVLKNLEEGFVIDKFKIKVSSGFYVRQFVSDFAKSFGTVATTFHIKRLQIGEYAIA